MGKTMSIIIIDEESFAPQGNAFSLPYTRVALIPLPTVSYPASYYDGRGRDEVHKMLLIDAPHSRGECTPGTCTCRAR